MKKYGLILLLAAVTVLASCDLKIPVKKMTRAKELITEAESYDAQIHAPKDLNKAKKLLKDSHTLVAEKKVDDAEVQATDARDVAKKAIAKSHIRKADTQSKRRPHKIDCALEIWL